jgi:hypothetical protein
MTLLSRFLGLPPGGRQGRGGPGITAFECPEGPDIKDIVDISLDSEAEPLVTMVEGNDRQEVTIEGPVNRAGRLVHPPIGTGGLLVWRPSGGLQQAPVTVVRVSRAHPIQWGLRFTGEATKCQRRTFVRADVFLPVLLTVAGEQVAATGVDLSEGGMCARVPKEVRPCLLDRVSLTFDIGVALTVAAEVIRTSPHNEDTHAELGCDSPI